MTDAEADKRAMELLARVGLPDKATVIRFSFPAVSSSVLPLRVRWR